MTFETNDILSLSNQLSFLASLFESFCNYTKEYTFTSHYFLLKNQIKSFFFEVLIVIIQTLQIVTFAFTSHISVNWKPEILKIVLTKLLEYFHLVVFLEQNTKAYFIFYYFTMIIIGLTAFLEWLIFKKLNKKGKVFQTLLNILQVILFSISTLFYIPIIELLLSIFQCEISSNVNNNLNTGSKAQYYNIYGNTFLCWQGIHYMHISFGLFFLIMFLIKTLLFVSTYFETNYDNSNPIGKKTASQDLVNKIIIFFFLLLSNFVCPYLSDSLIIIIVMGIISLIQLYYFYILAPHYNATLFKLNLGSKAVISWSFICACLGRLMLSVESFNCNILIFIFAIPLIFLIIFSKEHDRLNELISLSRRQRNGSDYIQIVDILLEQFDEIKSRSAQIILPGYAFYIESTCSLPECALKKYISSINNTKEASIFLLKHIETIFNNGINKYPFCIPLRIRYCRFLIERLNKKQYAYNEFTTISLFSQNFEEQFILFRYKKLYEEYGYFRFKEYDIEIYNSTIFHQLTQKFQTLIIKVSLLYVDFWTLLFQNYKEHQQNLTKLNEIGTQIHIQVNKIEEVFVDVNKAIHNEKEILILYYDFVSEILHDNYKQKTLKHKILELEEIAFDDIVEQKLENFDIHQLSKTDRFLYMIINGQYDQRIINLSLSLCSHLGYTKEELWGANINDLVPNTLRKYHDLMMKSKVDNYVKLGTEFTHSKLEYHDIIAFAINKSKYLIPFAFKQCYIHTENKEDYWLLKVIKDHRSNPSTKTCYVITDLNMNIQNFTGNSMQLLGLNSFAITNSIDITKSIKEYHEEYYRKVLDHEDKSTETKCNIKRLLIQEKFKTPIIITWRKIEYQSTIDNENNRSDDQMINRILTATPTGNTSASKDFFFLSVNTLTLLDQSCGFLFTFEPVQGILGSYSPSLSSKKNPVSMESSTSLLNYNNNQQQIQIEKGFLPSFDSRINFNPIQLSYSINQKILNEGKPNHFREILCKEAYGKIKNDNAILESEKSSISSVNSNESYESEENTITSRKSIESNYRPLDNIIPQLVIGEHNKKSNDNNTNDVYKVNFTNIKYSIIDYKSNRFIDQNEEMIPQIQYVIDESIKNNIIKLNGLSINEISPTKQSEIQKDNGKNKLLSQIENTEQIKYFSMNKQIEDALSNEESQESIVKLSWISVLLFFIIIINHSVFLGISLECIQKIVDNIKQIENSYLILDVSLLSMFHVKELLYLQFDAYHDFYQPKDDYILNNTEEIYNLYVNMTELVDKLSLNSMKLSSTNYNRLYNSLIQIDLIENGVEIFSYQLTLISSLSKLGAALFSITQLPQKERTALQPDMFFFSRNIINYPLLALFNQTELYKDELDSTIRLNKIKVISTFGVCWLILLSTYFIIEKSLNEVIKRKESYLEIFYEISEKIILLSLEQCYLFIEKTQNTLNQIINESISDDTIDGEVEMLNEKKTEGKYNKAKSFQEKHNHNNTSKESSVLKIKIVVSFFITVLLASISLILFIEHEDSYNTYVNVYIIENKMKNNVLLGFNTIREYIFNQSSPILGLDLSWKSDTLYNEYITTIQKLDNEMKKYESEYDKDYFLTHKTIHFSSLCNYTQYFFDTFFQNDPHYNCDYLLSGAAKYGISILLSSFFDELNDYKNSFFSHVKSIQSLNADRANNEIVVPPVNKYNYYKMQELVISLRFMILPIFNQLTENVINEIWSFSQYQTMLFLVVEICYISLAILWFIIRWRTYLISLSQIIFKTKNLLAIIPLDVLASLSSIHKVLKIKKIPVMNNGENEHF